MCELPRPTAFTGSDLDFIPDASVLHDAAPLVTGLPATVLDDAGALAQRNASARPSLAGGLIGGIGHFEIVNTGDVLEDIPILVSTFDTVGVKELGHDEFHIHHFLRTMSRRH